jgi:hypothetical protein
MSLNIYNEAASKAGIHNQVKFGNPSLETASADSKRRMEDKIQSLKVEASRRMKDLVRDVVQLQVDGGALDYLDVMELEVLVSRIDDLTADDFRLVEPIVDALIPKPTGQKINLEDEGINIPEDQQ